jgi:hypothetical protein
MKTNGRKQKIPVLLHAALLFAILIVCARPVSASWLTWYGEERLTSDPSASNLSANGARSVT